MTSTRATLYASLVFAVIFASVSMILGFGAILSLASGIIGAISGTSFVERSAHGLESSCRAGLGEIFRTGYRNSEGLQRRLGATSDPSPQGFGKLAGLLSEIFAFESPFQRVASYVFCIQALLGLVAICVFWMVQAAGVDTSALGNPSVGRLFVNAIPIEGGADIAKARFHHLFVPLVSLYAISLGTFGVAFLYSFGTASKNIRKHGPLMLFIAVVVFCLWLFLFYAGSPQSGLKRLIIQGNALGYLGFFVLTPIFYLILTAALPGSRRTR
jgi:hypothetical protein